MVAIASVFIFFKKIVFEETKIARQNDSSHDLSSVSIESPLDYETLVSFPHRQDEEGFFFEDLDRELVFFGQNLRPDRDKEDPAYFLALSDRDMIEKVKPQVKIYLKYGRKQLEFSDSPTPLWLKVSYLDEEKAKIDAGIWIVDEENGAVIQRKLKLEKSAVQKLIDLGSSSFDAKTQKAFEELEQLNYLGPDKLYDAYGDGQYEEFKHLSRILVGLSVFYLKKGDLLIFNDHRWMMAKQDELDTKDFPLAVCMNDSVKAFEIKAFSPSGLISTSFKPKTNLVKNLSFKMEDVLKNIRIRGEHTFTCKLQQKSQLLRVGDWLIRQKEGWRLLNKWEELQNYLSYQVVGELFIIDGIEKRQGSTVLKGTLFDKMRTLAQMVKIPVIETKKPSKKATSKKGRANQKLELSEERKSTSHTISGGSSDDEELLHFVNPKQHYGHPL